MHPFQEDAVRDRFDAYPKAHRHALLQLREWVLDAGDALAATGGIRETLKWDEPSYLPVKARVGSAVRIGVHDDEHVALYFNCQSLIVENIRAIYGDELAYSKNRAVLFNARDTLPESVVKRCARLALHYHRDKRRMPDAS